MIDMRRACNYAWRMPCMIQIRNVPDELHRTLKSRAALAGQSLSDYLLREVQGIASRPTAEEMLARLRSLSSVVTTTDPVDIIREERDRR